MRAFEIQTFQSGKWKIDSVFDDRELAVFEAQRMEGSKRYSGVRVVEETFDEKTQQVAVRTIYKGTCVDQQPLPEPPKKQAAKAAPQPARGAAAGGRRSGKAPAGPKETKSSGTLMALFGIILMVGLGAVVALRVLSGGK